MGREADRYTDGRSRRLAVARSLSPGAVPQESWHQADLPTQEGVPAQDARLPRPDGNAGWAERAQGPPAQGPQAVDACRSTLTRPARLRGRGGFAWVRAWHAQASAGPVRVHAAPSGESGARLGLSTPGIRGAVERNRLRRRLREAVRAAGAGEGCDLIVSAGADALTLPFEELTRQVERAIQAAAARARSAPVPSPVPGGHARAQNGDVPRPGMGGLRARPGGTTP